MLAIKSDISPFETQPFLCFESVLLLKSLLSESIVVGSTT